MNETKMIVGLGNPGTEYADTRHNIGFSVIDALAEFLGIEIKKKKFHARFGMGNFADKKLILLKPLLYMNHSGLPVAAAAAFYKIVAKDLLVVVDDMDGVGAGYGRPQRPEDRRAPLGAYPRG